MAISGGRVARRERTSAGGWVRRGLVLLAVPFLVLPLVSLVFIGARCYAPAPRTYTPPLDPPGLPGYTRAEAFTYLTLPEWYIVYSTEEQARFVQHASPSDFPYVGAVAQYWRMYGAACDATRGRYPFETGYHVMLGLIGVSFTIENGVKTLYENTVGLLSGWLFTTETEEDRFAAAVAREYGAFMHHTPWYRFPFGKYLEALWSRVPLRGPHVGRKWERRLALSAEYAVKGAYGWLLGLGTQAAYGPEGLRTYARVTKMPPRLLTELKADHVQKTPTGEIVTLPRYEAFTPAALALIARGAQFTDIAGNREILLTVRAPATFDLRRVLPLRLVTRELMLTRPDEARLALSVDVAQLSAAVVQLRRQGLSVEHIYDY